MSQRSGLDNMLRILFSQVSYVARGYSGVGLIINHIIIPLDIPIDFKLKMFTLTLFVIAVRFSIDIHTK